MTLTETAYAKINLALHVRRRREDGYHELETLFAFVDAGDTLTARVAKQDKVITTGEFAGGIDNPFDNLVAKALGVLPRAQALEITLEKNLPVAAGLGGGSADAGAVFRIVREAFGLPDDWRERAARLGADVPACVDSDMHIGLGVGEERREVVNDLEGTPVLLVNPREPLSTPPVFRGWDGKDRGPLPSGSAREIALAGRNDLRKSAISICPQIADVLSELSRGAPIQFEMSGSGATCYALYESCAARDEAQRRIEAGHPDWWQMTGRLR